MDSLDPHLVAFRQHLTSVRQFSPHTIRNYLADVGRFHDHLVARRLELVSVTPAQVVDYFNLLKTELASTSRARHVSSLKCFYRYLVRQRTIRSSPLKLVRVISPQSKARTVPRVDEVARILEQPPEGSALGWRDRAVLELLYSGGLRVSEVAALDIDDVDLRERMVRVTGKGSKERLCPINPMAAQVIGVYLQRRGELRSRKGAHPTALIVGRWGRRLTPGQIRERVAMHSSQAGTQVSPHTLRHAYATHLLHNGAHIESIQELMGHESLTTTQIYAHVTLEYLQQVHAEAHPRAAPSQSELQPEAPAEQAVERTRSRELRCDGQCTPSAHTPGSGDGWSIHTEGPTGTSSPVAAFGERGSLDTTADLSG
ncbi:tyrosine-type recombinase/integrase [Hyalangium versicolor]|uniref:tyrosine-type recombinase/integrase n=1 Tax=Hyalangium versicolor TaxID=2861190 RepID=UPI001CCF74F9|nr:tyrosine-type recombinase/integrase [Hyalangium versicolor]